MPDINVGQGTVFCWFVLTVLSRVSCLSSMFQLPFGNIWLRIIHFYKITKVRYKPANFHCYVSISMENVIP